MFKKYISSFLLFLYLIGSIGINISLHYCGGSLASVAVISQASCCCDDDGKEDDCCENEYKTFKLEVDQEKTTLESNSTNELAIHSVVNFDFSELKSFSIKVVDEVQFLPQQYILVHRIPIYKMNHSFLFYG